MNWLKAFRLPAMCLPSSDVVHRSQRRDTQRLVRKQTESFRLDELKRISSRADSDTCLDDVVLWPASTVRAERCKYSFSAKMCAEIFTKYYKFKLPHNEIRHTLNIFN